MGRPKKKYTMSEKLKRYKIVEGVNFNVLKDNRFKTGRISVLMFLPLDEKMSSRNAILPFILTRACKKYPDFTSLQKKLGEMYGALLEADVEKLGESQVMSVSITFLDDRFVLEDKNLAAKSIELLNEVLFRPNLVNNKFSDTDVEQEKRQLIEAIDAEYNNKRTYAVQRCFEHMCSKEKFGISPLGVREKVQELTALDVYAAWMYVLKHARFEYVMLGRMNDTEIIESVKSVFAKVKQRKVADDSIKVIKSADQIRRYTEYDDITQSKLVMGFRVGSSEPNENAAAIRVMNALFGGTPTSKLFVNVREKLSLCYYCSSRYDRTKGVMHVNCGVKKENIDKAVNEILEQLEDIKAGNFTDTELSEVKFSLCNDFKTISDCFGQLEGFYFGQIVTYSDKSPEEVAAETSLVTREQVIKAAQKVTLDTVYTLSSKG